MIGLKVVLFAACFTVVLASRDWSKITPSKLYAPSQVRGHGIPSPRIAGGNESKPHSHPYQVGVITPLNGGDYLCSGSLIKPNVVLTAAHCFQGAEGATRVILGAHNIDEDEPTQVRLNASKVIIHENWDINEVVNDVALVILPQEVTLNENIGLIRLPDDDSDNYENDIALVTGWGYKSDDATDNSPVLREVTVPVLTNSVCNSYFMGIIKDTHICTSGDDGKSPCFGDWGDPLVVDDTQIGFYSFGIIFGCEIGFPSAYTRTSKYIDWINKNSS